MVEEGAGGVGEQKGRGTRRGGLIVPEQTAYGNHANPPGVVVVAFNVPTQQNWVSLDPDTRSVPPN